MACRIEVTHDAVTLHISGFDRAWCLRRTLRIPMGDITAARVAERSELQAELGLRVGGGYWPGRLTTGWFLVRGDRRRRQFWCVFRDRELLAIGTRLRSPSKVVVQTPDRVALAQTISARIIG
jgi:hypothetical protein